jgi:hypothetical protein
MASPRAWFVVSVSLLLACVAPVWAAKPYKIYVINKYGAWDIVCDSYTVQRDDHVWEILRRKGSIAEEDFPRFVEILKSMNPNIQDVNKIYPNEKILIPLKQLPAKEGRVDVGPRYVTIPMIPDVLYKGHAVTAGECLSRIVTAHLGLSWHEIPPSYFDTLRRLNPRIRNLDLIYAGETLRVPDLTAVEPSVNEGVQRERQIASAAPAVDDAMPPAVDRVAARGGPIGQANDEDAQEKERAVGPKTDPALEEPRAENELGPLNEEVPLEAHPVVSVSEGAAKGRAAEKQGEMGAAELPNDSSTEKTELAVGDSGAKTALAKRELDVLFPSGTASKAAWQDVVSRVASGVGARLLASGSCFFPGEQGKDVALNLAAFPVLEFGDGRHLLFETGLALPRDIEKTIRSTWRGLMIVHADLDETAAVVLEKVFRALFGDNLHTQLALPAFDDGVQVTLRGDWVAFQEQGKGKGRRYYAVTLLDDAEERTSPAVVTYLKGRNIFVLDISTGPVAGRSTPLLGEDKLSKDGTIQVLDGSGQEAFVSGFVQAMGFFYAPRSSVSFEYAGFEVHTVGNLVYGAMDLDVMVDFGTFYGDARTAIEAGGVKVLAIKPEESLPAIARELLDVLGASHEEIPVLFAANRKLTKAISVALPGLLLSYGKEDGGFLSFQEIAPELLHFLAEQKVKPFIVKNSPLVGEKKS